MDFRVGAVEGLNLFPKTESINNEPEVKNPFQSVFRAAMDLVEETNQYQLVAEQLQTDLATGKTDDILAVLLAQEKAYSTLNFTVQITNKIIESYREIMRISL